MFGPTPKPADLFSERQVAQRFHTVPVTLNKRPADPRENSRRWLPTLRWWSLSQTSRPSTQTVPAPFLFYRFFLAITRMFIEQDHFLRGGEP